MTGFLIGVGAAGLEDRTFDDHVVLEFSSESAFTAMFRVEVPLNTYGAPVVKGGPARVEKATAKAYTLRVTLPAGDSIVSVTPVESLEFTYSGSDEGARNLVKVYSVGSAFTGGVPEHGFWLAKGLVEVNLPNCTGVGERAFSGCSALKKFVGGSLGTMSDGGFYNCTSLTDFTATRTANIGNSVWDGCSALTDLSLPGCSLTAGYNDKLGTLSALQYLRFPDKTLAKVQSMVGYRYSIGYRKGVTLVCSDGSQVIT